MAALKEHERLEKELETVFQKALAAEPNEAAKEALIASQRAWQLYCEADGRYESVSTGPASARTFYVSSRMSYLIRLRIHHLQTPFAQGWMEQFPVKR